MCFYVVIKVRNILSPGGFGKGQPFSFFWDLSYGRFWLILLNFQKNTFFQRTISYLIFFSVNHFLDSIHNISHPIAHRFLSVTYGKGRGRAGGEGVGRGPKASLNKSIF